MNNIINSSGIYDINAYNLTTKNATVLSTLNIGGYIIGSGTGLTNLIYGNIINKPDLASTANLDSLSTTSTLNISNLQSTSTSLLNKTNFTNLLVSSDSTFLSSLNVSGTTSLNNITTINSSLNVSGYTTLSGGTITGKVLMNGTIVNDHSLQIKTDNHTAPLLQIDSGVRRQVAINTNPRAIGKVFLGLGGRGCTGVGDYYAIGFGYLYNPTDPYCCEIGVVITNFSGAECGDLIFSTRNTTGQYDVATERMRIKSDGTITINNNTTLLSSFNVSGTTTLNNNTTLSSSLNVSGFTTLSNNTTCISSFNVSGTTTLNNATSCISSFNVSGVTTLLNNVTIKGELINQYWKFTNDSDYCRLNGVGGGYFKFAAQELYSAADVNANGIIYANGDKLNFPNLINQYKINLYGTNSYGFGIAGDTLQYSSQKYHKFYNSSNNLNTFTIDSTGNIICVGILNVSSSTTLNNATTCISSLNVSGLTTLSNNTTCISSLNVSGFTTLNNNTTCISSLNVSGITTLSNSVFINTNTINNYLFNNTGFNHSTYLDFNAIDKFGYTFIQSSTNGPGTGASSYYSWYIGLGNEYPFSNSVNGYYGMQFAVGRSESYPKLSVRRKENNSWTSWEGLTSEKAVSLTSGDKTISGNLTVNNITLASNGKINCVDDYHYIQLDQTTDTLTLQEYGKISFNIGITKTQKALINFTTFSIFNNTIISGNTTLLSSLNVSGITTLNILLLFMVNYRQMEILQMV